MGIDDSTRDGKLAEVILRVPGVCAWLWQVGTDDLKWSDSLIALFGFHECPRNVGDFLAAIVPEDRSRVASEIQGYIKAGDSFDHEFASGVPMEV